MITQTFILKSEHQATQAALYFIKRSAYFSITPLPFDEWQIEFKPHEGHEAALEIIMELKENPC